MMQPDPFALASPTADAEHGLAPDNDLLDLLVGREEPQGDLDCPEVKSVLEKIRARDASGR